MGPPVCIPTSEAGEVISLILQGTKLRHGAIITDTGAIESGKLKKSPFFPIPTS